MATSSGLRGAGSVRWQSPELLFHKPKSYASDVYAFGMTIAEVRSVSLSKSRLCTDC